MTRPTADKWLAARKKWESDPTKTFEDIGGWLGVSRVAVSKKASKEGWQRVASMRDIVERAQRKADEKVTAKLSKVTAETSKSPGPDPGSVEAAIDVRAAVIESHRSDWNEHRELFTLSSIELDFDAGKKAKISAEMLSLRQKGERAAYGLDVEEKPAPEFDAMTDDELSAKIQEKLDRLKPSRAG